MTIKYKSDPMTKLREYCDQKQVSKNWNFMSLNKQKQRSEPKRRISHTHTAKIKFQYRGTKPFIRIPEIHKIQKSGYF